jgi:hypothetical protein
LFGNEEFLTPMNGIRALQLIFLQKYKKMSCKARIFPHCHSEQSEESWLVRIFPAPLKISPAGRNDKAWSQCHQLNIRHLVPMRRMGMQFWMRRIQFDLCASQAHNFPAIPDMPKSLTNTGGQEYSFRKLCTVPKTTGIKITVCFYYKKYMREGAYFT